MSEIDDLEAYEDRPLPLDNALSAARRRNGLKALAGFHERTRERVTRQHFLDDRRRPEPSLPRVKWLERADP